MMCSLRRKELSAKHYTAVGEVKKGWGKVIVLTLQWLVEDVSRSYDLPQIL